MHRNKFGWHLRPLKSQGNCPETRPGKNNMEKLLPPDAVVNDAQLRLWISSLDQKPQHNGSGCRQTCLFLLFVPASLTDCLASLNDHALRTSVLLRWKLTRQLHQLGQPVQAGMQDITSGCHLMDR